MSDNVCQVGDAMEFVGDVNLRTSYRLLIMTVMSLSLFC
jgi:hypothetical protein